MALFVFLKIGQKGFFRKKNIFCQMLYMGYEPKNHPES